MHTVQLKPAIKVQISGRMAYIGINDFSTASVSSEKNRLKKLMLIVNKLTSAMKQRPEK